MQIFNVKVQSTRYGKGETMKRYYRDFYGYVATITELPNGKWRVRIHAFNEYTKTCATFGAAKKALRSTSVGWREVEPC